MIIIKDMEDNNITNQNNQATDQNLSETNSSQKLTSDSSLNVSSGTSGTNPEPVVITPKNETPSTPIPSESEVDEKIRLAKLAMEGPERTARREQHEKTLETKNQEAELKKQLAEINKNKEVLELAWIGLDTDRGAIKNLINPIIDKESKLEQEETTLEEQEKATVSARDKEAIEKKRQAIETARQAVEKEKWIYQDRLFKIEDQIKDNTNAYQKLLDEEEGVLQKMEKLKQSLI